MNAKSMKRTLTPKEFVIAGLLNEAPAHGYELEQKIRERGMRNWTSIGFSSIYHVLNTMKKSGYVSQSSRQAKGKLQQIYALTDSGREILMNQIRHSLVTVGKESVDFDVAISNTPGLPPDEVKDLLLKRIQNLENAVADLKIIKQKKLISGAPDMPAITILFDRPIAFMEAEIRLLETYLPKFEA